MIFELTHEETSKLKEWEKKHACPLRKQSSCDAVTTVSFKLTARGTEVYSTCLCGATFLIRKASR